MDYSPLFRMLRIDYMNILNKTGNMIDEVLLKIFDKTISKNVEAYSLTTEVEKKLESIHPVFRGEEDLDPHHEVKFSYLTLLNDYVVYRLSDFVKEEELSDAEIKRLVKEIYISVFKVTSEEYGKVKNTYSLNEEKEIFRICNHILSYSVAGDVRNPFEEICMTIEYLDWFLRFLANLRHFNIEITKELALDYFIDYFSNDKRVYTRLNKVRFYCYNKGLIERLKFQFDYINTISIGMHEDKKQRIRYLIDFDKNELSEGATHKYSIEHFDEYILLVVKSLLDEEKKVFICEYCNSPYISVRSDSHFCTYPYKNGVKKSCMDYVSQVNCKKKKKTDK